MRTSRERSSWEWEHPSCVRNTQVVPSRLFCRSNIWKLKVASFHIDFLFKTNQSEEWIAIKRTESTASKIQWWTEKKQRKHETWADLVRNDGEPNKRKDVFPIAENFLFNILRYDRKIPLKSKQTKKEKPSRLWPYHLYCTCIHL